MFPAAVKLFNLLDFFRQGSTYPQVSQFFTIFGAKFGGSVYTRIGLYAMIYGTFITATFEWLAKSTIG